MRRGEDAKVGWLVGRSIGRAGERSRYVAIAELRPVENRDGKPQDGGVLGELSHKSLKGPNSERECQRKVRGFETGKEL